MRHRFAISPKASVVFFGLFAALGYAIQNSVTKPIAIRLGADLSTLWLIVASQITLIAFGITLLAFNKDAITSVFQMYSSARGVLRLTIISMLNVASLSIYIYAIGRIDQVFLSVLLNVYPFWYLVIGKYVFPDEFGNRDISGRVWIVFAVCLTSMVAFGYKNGHRAMPLETPLFAMIPVIYCISYYLRSRYFSSFGLIPFVVASQLLDAPLIMTLCLVALWVIPHSYGLNDIFHFDLLLYVLGTIASSGALYCLYRGSLISEKYAWLPSFMLFLVPGFTALISYQISERFHINLEFNLNYLYLVAILTICLLALNKLEKRPI